MCSKNEADQVVEFNNHYVIKPSIIFFDKKVNYLSNNLKEKGKKVKKKFEYTSDKNPNLLSKIQLSKMLKKNGFI